MTDEEFDQIEAEYESAKSALEVAKEKCHAAMILRAKFKVGDVIVREGVRRKVERVLVRYDEVRFECSKEKKDKSFGRVVTEIYSDIRQWELEK